MKAAVLLAFALLLLASPSFGQFDFAKQAFQGSRDMLKAYNEMREANYKGADKYFHARATSMPPTEVPEENGHQKS
uniref:Serum amyloid A protein n=1 Tax=Dolomedes mizhoanus TaxID=1366394 RepID=S5MFJ8_9ARAC|nr:serum amyloid A protein precursor [Dolomedes mizhoanus]